MQIDDIITLQEVISLIKNLGVGENKSENVLKDFTEKYLICHKFLAPFCPTVK